MRRQPSEESSRQVSKKASQLKTKTRSRVYDEVSDGEEREEGRPSRKRSSTMNTPQEIEQNATGPRPLSELSAGEAGL